MKNFNKIFPAFCLVMFCTAMVFGGCKKPNEKMLIGTWKLIKFENGFSPISTYNNGEIQWIFNSNSTIKVVIVNGTTITSTLPLNTNGNYNYTTNDNKISLDKIDYIFRIIDNQLFIEDLATQSACEKKLTFNKIK